MTAAEQAADAVGAWAARCGHHDHAVASDAAACYAKLIERLTPVYQAAEDGAALEPAAVARIQKADERTRIAEGKVAQLHEALRRHILCAFFSERDAEVLKQTKPA